MYIGVLTKRCPDSGVLRVDHLIQLVFAEYILQTPTELNDATDIQCIIQLHHIIQLVFAEYTVQTGTDFNDASYI